MYFLKRENEINAEWLCSKHIRSKFCSIRVNLELNNGNPQERGKIATHTSQKVAEIDKAISYSGTRDIWFTEIKNI